MLSVIQTNILHSAKPQTEQTVSQEAPPPEKQPDNSKTGQEEPAEEENQHQNEQPPTDSSGLKLHEALYWKPGD